MTDVCKEYMYNASKVSIISLCSFISFLVTYCIVFSMWQSFILSMIAGIISGLIVGYLSHRTITNIDSNKIHRKNIVFDVLKKFQKMNVSYDEQELNLIITGLEELKDKKIYNYTLGHLDSYPPLLDYWNKSNDLIKDITNKINKLEKYAFDNINGGINVEYKKILSFPIRFIIKETTEKDIAKPTIKIEDSTKHINISVDGEQWIYIHYKTLNKTKIKNFLMNLGNDIGFQNKLTEIRGNYKDAKELFYDKFKPKLEKLIDALKGREEDLKGKCEDCSYLVKWFGDC